MSRRDLRRLLEILERMEDAGTSRKIHALRAEFRSAVRVVVRALAEGGRR